MPRRWVLAVSRKRRVGGGTRQHDAHAHAELCDLARERFGERVHRGLGRAVNAHQRQWLQRDARRHVHDDPGLALAHLRQHRLGDRDGAEGVGLEQLADRAPCASLERCGRAEAGVVDQHVDRPGGLDAVANALRVGDVERSTRRSGRRQHVLARRAHRGDHLPVAIEEVARGFEAEAGRAAGDQDGLHGDSLRAGAMAPRYEAGAVLATIGSPYLIRESPAMMDPLAEVVTLLQPAAPFSKYVVGAGPWQVSRSDAGQPFYCAVLEGGCRLALDGSEAIVLQAGDFVLIPATFGVATSSLAAERVANSVPAVLGRGPFRIGAQEGPADLRMLAGHCSFGSPDAALLVSLLPQLVHVRGEQRLATLVQLVGRSRASSGPRATSCSRGCWRCCSSRPCARRGTAASPGLVRGLADARLAAAMRAMHEQPTRAWTVDELAKEAALSRSAFFERFSARWASRRWSTCSRGAWRSRKTCSAATKTSVAEVAERVGYSSASTFSVAFTRHVGRPPTHYAREQGVAEEAAPRPTALG